MKKKFEFSDFMTKTNNEKSSQMDLLLDGAKTGHYLMVKGSEAKSVQRAKIIAQVGYADAEEAVKDIKCPAEKNAKHLELKESATIKYCLTLVDGWSFGDFDLEKLKLLLSEHSGLAFSVVGFSSTEKNYLAK